MKIFLERPAAMFMPEFGVLETTPHMSGPAGREHFTWMLKKFLPFFE
jgi:hypothetical protein